MSLDNRLIPILESIDFACRYKELCDEFNDFKSRAIKYDLKLIEEFYQEKGLKVKYNNTERFFKVSSTNGNIAIQFNTIPKRGFLQFVLNVKQNGENLSLAYGMWEAITREMIQEEASKPIFTDESDLVKILDIATDLYQEFEEEVYKNLQLS